MRPESALSASNSALDNSPRGFSYKYEAFSASLEPAASVGCVNNLLLFADTVQAEVEFTRKTHGLPPDGADLLANLDLTRYKTHDPRDLAQVRRTVHLFDGRLAERGSLNLEVA